MDGPFWLDDSRIKIGFLDAAYKGVGGDRCIFGELQIGYEPAEQIQELETWNVVNQNQTNVRKKQIIALIDLTNVPINVKIDVEPEDQIVTFVREQCGRRGIAAKNFFYDSGMRTSLVSAFSRQWSPDANPIDCGGAPSDRPVNTVLKVNEKGRDRPKRCDEHYSKFITELWFSVRLAIEAGQFRGMREAPMQEGCQREWLIVGANKIEVEPKRVMKEKTGKSPDLFDSIAIGVEGARRLGFIIEGFKSVADDGPAFTPNNRWRKELKERANDIWRGSDLNHAT